MVASIKWTNPVLFGVGLLVVSATNLSPLVFRYQIHSSIWRGWPAVTFWYPFRPSLGLPASARHSLKRTFSSSLWSPWVRRIISISSSGILGGYLMICIYNFSLARLGWRWKFLSHYTQSFECYRIVFDRMMAHQGVIFLFFATHIFRFALGLYPFHKYSFRICMVMRGIRFHVR